MGLGLGDVAICTDLFGDAQTREYSELSLACLLWCLVFANESYLLSNAGKNAPPLYSTSVRWEAEVPLGRSACRGGDGQERFLGIAQILEEGAADCEDLACWRVSELRTGHVRNPRRGLPPFPGHPKPVVIPCPWPVMKPAIDVVPAFFTREVKPGTYVIHILVFWPQDGFFEDPSRVLGMGGARRYG